MTSSRSRSRRTLIERAAAEGAALIRRSTLPPPTPSDFPHLARGDGHAVLVLPPSFRSDAATMRARVFLAELGYTVYGWDLGVNIGPTRPLIAGAAGRLFELSGRHGPISLVGFSLGGLYARLLAARFPAQIRHVITIGSPVDQPAESLWFSLEPYLGLWRGNDLHALAAELALPLDVPASCIYSREDGIVTWSHCLDHRSKDAINVEVSGCHITMMQSVEALRVIAERLSEVGI